MSTATEWGKAYASQAKADFAARDTLAQHAGIPQCQSLHYLQMACEKLCKAHLCYTGSDPRALQSSHAYVAKNLPSIARQVFTRILKRPLRDHGWEMSLMRQLSREIELLAPSVDDNQTRPDNCEYPWEDHAARLFVPAEYSFPNRNLLQAQFGRIFLKVIGAAIDSLAG